MEQQLKKALNCLKGAHDAMRDAAFYHEQFMDSRRKSNLKRQIMRCNEAIQEINRLKLFEGN